MNRCIKEIPETVTRVGIVTSSSGAAIHDILTTLQRRFPMEKTIVYCVKLCNFPKKK